MLICGTSVALQKKQFHRALGNWFRAHGRNLPWRKTRDPYAILVSEFMLQQTQVATVIPYYNKWFRQFPEFAALARASENDVLHAWQGLGYYARARNLYATAKIVQKRHGGIFPRDIAASRQLPGIGRYTANAVATFAFNRPVPILEANIARLLARLFDLRAPIDSAIGREKLWESAAQLVPKRGAARFNSALVDLGALVCLPRKPKCHICPVHKFCSAKNPETLPIKKARPPMKRLCENHAFIVQARRVLLVKAERRWRGMWVLPRLQRRPINQWPIYKSIFPFTNHRVSLNVYAQRRGKIDDHLQRWIRIDSLQSIPIPSPHRRAVSHLLSRARAERHTDSRRPDRHRSAAH